VINEDFIRKGKSLKKHQTLLFLLAVVEVEVEVEVMLVVVFLNHSYLYSNYCSTK
jgi:hypothetical protein